MSSLVLAASIAGQSGNTDTPLDVPQSAAGARIDGYKAGGERVKPAKLVAHHYDDKHRTPAEARLENDGTGPVLRKSLLKGTGKLTLSEGTEKESLPVALNVVADKRPPVVSVPVPQPQPNAVGRRVERGTIIEVAAAEPKAREAGFTTWREWCSVHWHTGRINDAKEIARVNAQVARGWNVILTVTPDVAGKRSDTRCPDFGVVADQLIDGGLDKRVIVQLVNEANLDTYWPAGNVAEATEVFAAPIAEKLKAAGYTLAAPSITWGSVPKINAWLDQIFAAVPAGTWDYLDGHTYLGSVKEFETVWANYAAQGKARGVKVLCSEWNFKIGNGAFAKNLPVYLAAIEKYVDTHCFFSFTFGDKFNPLNPYCWRDGKTTETFDAWKRLNTAAVKGAMA